MSIQVREMTPRDFIREYGLMIHDLDALRFGLLLSCGDSLEQASRLALGNEQDRVLRACNYLHRVGYMQMPSA